MKKNNLHVKREPHFLLECAQINFDQVVTEWFLVDVLIRRLLKEAKESIVDYSREQCVLKEGHLVNELSLIAGRFWTVASHGQVGEDCSEIGPNDVV